MNSPRGWFPPPSKPLPVEGGLKARSERGAIGEQWWSQRFVEVLEGIGVGTRLQRGRNYARRGQVLSLEVDAGLVTARVQGSRERPYRVRIGVPAFGKREWSLIEASLAADAWYAAKLLAGEMPDDIEGVFAGVGLSLFPAEASDLTMDCSCPDWEIPCKHLAAVFYLLAEAFDDDPFTILAWRGRERQDLLENLAAARSGGAPAADHGSEAAGRPLEECIDTFWAAESDLPVTTGAMSSSTALLEQLPEVDIDVRGHSLIELLRPAYESFDPEPPPAE